MKIKTSGTADTVILETNSRDAGLPPVPLAGLEIKKILAPIDFSSCSRKALDYAVLFARQFGAELVLLHVVEPPPPQMAIVEGALMDTTLRQDAAEQLGRWRTEAASGLNSKAVLRDGPAEKEIVAAAEETNTDLIVIGNLGRRGLARAFMGSTAEKVVRHAPCPVLVIRYHEHDFIAESQERHASAVNKA